MYPLLSAKNQKWFTILVIFHTKQEYFDIATKLKSGYIFFYFCFSGEGGGGEGGGVEGGCDEMGVVPWEGASGLPFKFTLCSPPFSLLRDFKNQFR